MIIESDCNSGRRTLSHIAAGRSLINYLDILFGFHLHLVTIMQLSTKLERMLLTSLIRTLVVALSYGQVAEGTGPFRPQSLPPSIELNRAVGAELPNGMLCSKRNCNLVGTSIPEVPFAIMSSQALFLQFGQSLLCRSLLDV